MCVCTKKSARTIATLDGVASFFMGPREGVGIYFRAMLIRRSLPLLMLGVTFLLSHPTRAWGQEPPPEGTGPQQQQQQPAHRRSDYPYPAFVSGTYQLLTDQRLKTGESLSSPNGKFRLILEASGDLVLQDGNLVIYSADDQPIWASGTSNNPICRTCQILALQDDGNVVIYRDGKPLWATHTNQF